MRTARGSRRDRLSSSATTRPKPPPVHDSTTEGQVLACFGLIVATSMFYTCFLTAIQATYCPYCCCGLAAVSQ